MVTAPPTWVTDACMEQIVAARPARWGFRHETWIVERIDGRTIVLQRRVDRSDPTGPRARAVRELVRAAGLPTPEPVRVSLAGDEVVVALPFIDGIVAAELLGTDRGAALVGRVCGEIAARLGAMDPAGIRLSRMWTSGDSLRVATHDWIERLPVALPTATRERLLVALERAAREVDAASPRLVHGDLAPVNVLVRDDRLAAVLDLDRTQLAHPLYDAAWFAWVVSFHHGDTAEAAWDAYAREADVAARSPAAMAWMWPLQLLERLAEAKDAGERAMWANRLEAASGHTMEG